MNKFATLIGASLLTLPAIAAEPWGNADPRAR